MHKLDELCNRRERRPDVCRPALQQENDADRLLEDRVKAVRGHVVQENHRTSQTTRGAHPVKLFA